MATVSVLVRKSENTADENGALYIEGIDAPVLLKRNSRARRLILRVNESRREVNLTIPDHCNRTAALDFLNRSRGWLLKRLDRLPKSAPFEHGAIIPFRGQSHQILFVDRNTRNEVVSIDDFLEEGQAPQLLVSGGTEHGPRRLQDWLKLKARRDLKVRVDHHANRLNLKPTRITIRDQKSRWGSCSSSGALSFSWRLVLAPSHALDYVAAHEVAHLAEMNHGPKFWRLVRKTMPDFERSQDWLRAHGAALHRYGME